LTGQTGKRNIEKFCQSKENFSSFYQKIHHFISCSPWDPGEVKEVTNKINKEFYHGASFGYIIDEKSNAKKGRNSAGISRQYCGQTGKVDNCQTGVYSVLSGKSFTMPCNYRLYLAKEWIEDKKRLKKAGLPGKITYKTKVDLAMDMIREDYSQGLRPEWYGGDALYGKAGKLLRLIEDELEGKFVMDVAKDYMFYLRDPLKDKRTKAWTIEEWMNKNDIKKGRKVRYSADKKAYSHVVETYFIDWKKEPGKVRRRLLIISKGTGKNDKIKYSISNFPLQEKKPAELVYMQRARYSVEQYFREASQIGGMCDYQVRGARAWHHCQILTMMLMQLTVLVRAKLADKKIFLPTITLVRILECVLLKPKNYKIMLRNILKRHSECRYKSVF
jgi:SRSO17 transposase